MEKKTYLWKSMKAGLKSNNGNIEWQMNKWQKHKGELKICSDGFHASERITNAMQYVNMEVLALVEVRGKSLKQNDKQCWSEMRIIKTWKWIKKDSVKLAIYAAELALPIFEKEYPKDKRSRQAIEAAKKVLKSDTKKNRDAARDAWIAAWAADDAWAAEDARSAAWIAARDAAWAARDAAWAARDAAWAASAAASAAVRDAASAAAWAAKDAAGTDEKAFEKTLDKCEKYIKQIKEIK